MSETGASVPRIITYFDGYRTGRWSLALHLESDSEAWVYITVHVGFWGFTAYVGPSASSEGSP